MDFTQYLLMKLTQEAAEVAQAATKVMEFGPEGRERPEYESNLDALQKEVFDLIAVISLYGHQVERDRLKLAGAARCLPEAQAKLRKMCFYALFPLDEGRLVVTSKEYAMINDYAYRHATIVLKLIPDQIDYRRYIDVTDRLRARFPNNY